MKDSHTVGPSIDEATLTYVRNIRNSATSTAKESDQAFVKFKTAFDEWSPSSVVCIKPCDKDALDVIFYQSETLDMTQPLNRWMAELQSRIANLVMHWRYSFPSEDEEYDRHINDKEDVIFGDLQQVINAMESSTWDSYIDFYNTKDYVNDRRYSFLKGSGLPALKLLQAELEEMKCCNERIRNHLVVSIHGRSYTSVEILHTYRCYNTTELEGFQVYDETQLKTQSKFSLEADLLSLNTIYGISSDDPAAMAHDWLYLCAYFYKYPSVLFGDMKYSGSTAKRTAAAASTTTTPTRAGHWPNIHTFVKAAAERCSHIQRLFTEKMLYSNVASALQQKLTSNDIIEAEFQVLMNCAKMQITAADITAFRIAKLLFDYASPIRNFVSICTRYNFRLVHTDTALEALQLHVLQFYSSTGHRHRNNCIRFFYRLCDVFCPASDGKIYAEIDDEKVAPPLQYMVVLHKIDELTKTLSWLLPLQYVSHGPNVWHYVVMEMNWFGPEGFLKFNATYQNVYNALMVYSVSSEMSILKNVVPVIHLFSIIGKYKDSCKSIRELLQHFQNDDHDELRNCMNVPLLESYIYDANSRIDAIRNLLNCNATMTDDERIGFPADTPMLIVNGTLPPEHKNYDSTAISPKLLVTYGTAAEESTMRSWLDTHALPLNVGDLLVASGIRTMNDVRMLLTLGDSEMNDTIFALPKLDRIKLSNAIKQLATNAVGSEKVVTPDSTKKRKAAVAFFKSFY